MIYLFGFVNAGICLICFPLSNRVYPDFLVMRLFLEISSRIIGTNPSAPDYIDDNSQGLFHGLKTISDSLATMLGASVLFKLSAHMQN